MKYFKVTEDSKLHKDLKNLNVKKVANISNVSFSYIYELLNGKYIASEDVYISLKKAVKTLKQQD